MDQQVIGQVAGIEHRQGGWAAVAILEVGKQYPKKLSTKRDDLISLAQQMMGQVVTAGYNEQQSTNINPNNGQPYTNRYLEAIALGAVDLVGQPTQIQPQQYMPQQPQPQPQPQYQPQPVQQPQPQYAPQPQPVPQPQPQPIPQGQITHVVGTDQVREAKIHRQTGTKVAVELLQYLPPDERTLATLVRISEQLCHYYDNGVVWTTTPIGQQNPQVQHQGGYQGEAHDAQAQQQYQQQHQGGYENPSEGDFQPQPGDDGIPFQ